MFVRSFRMPALLLATCGLLAFTPAAHSVPVTFTAVLDGLSEDPPNASPGTGFATVIFDLDAHTMRVDTSFTGLLGTTTVAHIHCCVAPPGSTGAATMVPSFVGYPAGVTSGTYDHTFDTLSAATFNPSFITAAGGTTALAEAKLFDGLVAGEAYFNIHTNLFPAGEIRGFLAQVPEPGTLALLGLGLAGLAAARRRRQ